jgi:hypothetical protein
MLFGGSNWGSIAAPVSYTSYDYGGGINENRVAGPKMNEMRLQGKYHLLVFNWNTDLAFRLIPPRFARLPRC